MRRILPRTLAIFVVASVATGWGLFGGIALAVLLPFWLLLLAWRFDNHTGSLLLLASLLLVVMLVMVGLLALLALKR